MLCAFYKDIVGINCSKHEFCIFWLRCQPRMSWNSRVSAISHTLGRLPMGQLLAKWGMLSQRLSDWFEVTGLATARSAAQVQPHFRPHELGVCTGQHLALLKNSSLDSLNSRASSCKGEMHRLFAECRCKEFALWALVAHTANPHEATARLSRLRRRTSPFRREQQRFALPGYGSKAHQHIDERLKNWLPFSIQGDKHTKARVIQAPQTFTGQGSLLALGVEMQLRNSHPLAFVRGAYTQHIDLLSIQCT